MKQAKLVILLRPLPPTPTSRAFPKGRVMIREIRTTCSIAAMKITRFILVNLGMEL